MTREILFRLWDKVEKNYVDSSYYQISCDDGSLYRSVSVPLSSPLSAGIESVPQSRYILEQYTGLTDKNGTKIFEGDIVKIPDNYELYGFNSGEKYEIYFAYGGFRLKPKYHPKRKGYWLEDDNEVEIIGNIHEGAKK